MTTPMRRQYLQIKKKYPDAIVLFRLGDFYESFDEDAKLVSRVCSIVLTSRPVSKEKRVPLAGVPHHAVEGYLAKLIRAGHKVAIVEQVGQLTKALKSREVVRVVTPGTVMEPGLLEEKRNNFLCALVIEGGKAGIAHIDITTGEFATTQLVGDDLLKLVGQELARLEPAECLVPRDGGWGVEELREQLGEVPLTACESWHFDLETARRALLDHFGVLSLDGYGCADLPLAAKAAGAIIQYLQETQRAALGKLSDLSTYSTDGFMNLDAASRRNLELSRSIRSGTVKGSLLEILDETSTAMGGRLLRTWLNQPLLDIKMIAKRLEAVDVLKGDALLRTKLISRLKEMGDLERLTNRVGQGRARPRDLVGLRKSLLLIPQIKKSLPTLAQEAAGLSELELDPCHEVATLIGRAIPPDPPATLSAMGIIAPGFSPELDSLVSSANSAKDWVANLERSERKRTGIKSLKVGYNKVFGYYLEVTKANLADVPPEYIRKQTLVNSERFITPELKEYEALILTAEERIKELEARLFREVCQQVATHAARLLATARDLARLDVYLSFAEVALRHNYTRPRVTLGAEIKILGGRHPVVELTLPDQPFVPNDAFLSPEEGELIILTGPNMAGKSTYLRQVALIVLMAQMGSFVPAGEATIGLVDCIFTRIGAQDVIAQGASTFMVEMMETANILHHATNRSLLILDEIGRGTSTYDGLSIAWAVVEYIHNHPKLRAKTLFATHYHELMELAEFLPRVRNHNMAVVEEGDKVIFLYKVVPGGADRSYGIHVAKLAGIPKAVTQRAEEILDKLEGDRHQATWEVSPAQAQQLSLLPPEEHPVLKELEKLDIMSMSPLDALNKLYEWQRMKKGEEER